MRSAPATPPRCRPTPAPRPAPRARHHVPAARFPTPPLPPCRRRSTTTVPGPTTTAPTLDENGIPVQESDPNNSQLLPVFNSDPPAYCVVGPQQGTGEVFTNANAGHHPGQGLGCHRRSAPRCRRRGHLEQPRRAVLQPRGDLPHRSDRHRPRRHAPVGGHGADTTFSGSVEISGSFTEGDAKNLARVLNSGSLPVQLQLQSVQNVSPSLGKDSLHAAVIAGLVGVAAGAALHDRLLPGARLHRRPGHDGVDGAVCGASSPGSPRPAAWRSRSPASPASSCRSVSPSTRTWCSSND